MLDFEKSDQQIEEIVEKVRNALDDYAERGEIFNMNQHISSELEMIQEDGILAIGMQLYGEIDLDYVGDTVEDPISYEIGENPANFAFETALIGIRQKIELRKEA